MRTKNGIQDKDETKRGVLEGRSPSPITSPSPLKERGIKGVR